jgi:hypothetical protein
MQRLLLTALFALLLAGAAGLLAGCATDDPDDIDRKPWLQPQQWEEMGPLPSTIIQGH